jgi:hypothetical protein
MSHATAIPAPEPRLPKRFRPLVRAVGGLGIGGRTDSEEVATTKQLIARDLRRLASEVIR